MIIEKYIRNILKSDELAGDILRVLSMFNNVLWESEIKWEIRSMNSTLNKKMDLSRVSDKLEMLSENGLLSLDRRIRSGASGKPVEEYIVRLLHPETVSDILQEDDKYRRYMDARTEAYKKFLGRD